MMKKINLIVIIVFFFNLFLWPVLVGASPQQLYQQAIQEAAQGNISRANTRLQAGMQLLAPNHIWYTRMQAASYLLQMRLSQKVTWKPLAPMQQNLAQAYVQQQGVPQASPEWVVGSLATFLPGSGHAYLGLWRDALSAVILVIPMLVLTLWAARRAMGPVTIFFSMITVWLWSGTVFSAVSLAERGSQEEYLFWWKGLWQAAALLGQPW